MVVRSHGELPGAHRAGVPVCGKHTLKGLHLMSHPLATDPPTAQTEARSRFVAVSKNITTNEINKAYDSFLVYALRGLFSLREVRLGGDRQ